MSSNKTATVSESSAPVSTTLPKTFAVGDTLVHPAHGVGAITAIEEKLVAGQACQLYVIQLQGTGLRVMVPKASSERVGLRPVMTRSEADAILEVLASPEIAVTIQPWNRRFRAYTEMMASGSATEIAKVLRDMHRLRFGKELSFGERRLLDQAKGLLIQELALAKGEPLEDVETQIAQIFAA